MRWLFTILFFICNTLLGQFTYSGYLYNANGSGANNVPVKLYRRTTATMTGFSSQTNYNNHSYYRSTGSATWTQAKTNCEAMGGHLTTVSNSSENSFLFNTWPSGWIGYYQDRVAGYTYSEPSGGFRWTENKVVNGLVSDYDVSSYTSGSTLTDITSSINATLYNSPAYTSTGGKYLTFNGSNTYGITNNLASKMSSSRISIVAWIYPTGNGVVMSELGVASASSGWHESVMEITGSNTLRVGFWNGTSISQLSTAITLNTWNMVCITYDGTTMRGYLNNVNFGSTNFTRAAAHLNGFGEHFAFGLSETTNMGSGAYGAYRLGMFQVFSRAITADEVDRTFNLYAYRYRTNQYTNWNSGEPNNSSNEDYTQFVTGGKWNDLANTSLPYVLEFDSIITTGSWTLYKTIYTNSSGYYSISESYDPTKEYYIQVDAPTRVQAYTNSDIQAVSNVILGKTTRTGLSFHMFDVNDDKVISIADKYYVAARKAGLFSRWRTAPDVRIFTVSERNAINAATTNVRATYPGVSTYTTSTLTSGGTLNLYIIAPGYAGQVTY
jgi:hypothetical protein